MAKVVANVPDYKSYGVPSGNTIAAQRQHQHAAERGKTLLQQEQMVLQVEQITLQQEQMVLQVEQMTLQARKMVL